jgi:hypothetical protein
VIAMTKNLFERGTYKPFAVVALMCAALCSGPAAAVNAAAGGANHAGTLPGAPNASQGGSGQVPLTNKGFGCQTGTWGIVDGSLQCVTSPPPVMGAINGHYIFVRVTSTGGWLTSPAVQLVGQANDIRVDAMNQQGSIVASCYLHTAGTWCSAAALSGTANASYQSTAGTMPDNGGVLRTAQGLQAAGQGLGGSNSGNNGTDNYVVSASFDASGTITLQLAGYFTYASTASSHTLASLFASLTITQAQFTSTGNGAVLNASSWAAP